MSTDTFSAIGSTHRVCQDHAVSGQMGTGAYAGVSDGCSQSPDSDFGSWALLRALTIYLQRDGPDVDVRHVLRQAFTITTVCHLPETALDATLLTAVHTPGYVDVQMWGDGVIAARERSGKWWYYRLEFKHGAPAYPSYLLDKARLKAYLAQTEQGASHLTVYEAGDSVEETFPEKSCPPGYTNTFGFDDVKYDMVVLFSDGVTSFVEKTTSGASRPVPLQEVLAEMLAFKGSMVGEFVQRRLRRFIKDVAKRNWQHLDDLSVAAIYMEAP